MIASPEDARLLFDRWREDARPVKIRLWASSLFFDGVGTVTDFSPETLEFGGDSWKFTIPVAGASFAFSDPREIPIASVRELETAQYEFGIALELPNGDRVIMMELQASSQPAPDSDE